MTGFSSDPFKLVMEHRYWDAIGEYDRLIKSGQASVPDLSNKATALLCLGRFDEALDVMKVIDEIDEARGGGRADPRQIGVVLWLMDRRDDAITAFRRSVAGVLDGSIAYTDFAGGASQGLLLWYAGVATGDPVVVEEATAYLAKIFRKGFFGAWPGPVAVYILGNATEEDVLEKATGSPSLERSLENADSDILANRQLVQALFYLSLKHREDGDEAEANRLMALCADRANPHLEMEWFLAQAEVGRGIGAGLTA
jgi:hypothetical protein